MSAHLTRTELVRRIAADPTSTALLLAGPTALELWPAAAESVRADPPRRTPTAYVSRFEWTGSELPTTQGELVLSHAATDDGAVATEARLVLDSLSPTGLRSLGQAFLHNLATAAELRSHAA